ncbi:dihydroorotase, partial [Mesorhizobium sp. M7D.F.Ca.US.004.03.1.1]
ALYGTILPGQPASAVKDMIAGGVVAFKVSTFESNPIRFPRIPPDQILDIFEALAGTSLPLGVHNEDQEIVRARIAAARASGQNGIKAHAASRPLAAELAATAQFLELGADAAAHAHIVHLTSRRGFRLVHNYLQDGYRSTGELCVHYLWFDPAVDEALGARIKVNPPIRPGEINALWQDVVDGRVAFVSSDHSSWPIDNKLTQSIFDAGAGMPGLETLLPAFFTGAERRGFDAAALTLQYLCARPAKFFGLWPRKGTIKVGADADLTVLSRATNIWDSAKAQDELNWSPFDGKEFTVSVARTYVGGQLAWDGNEILN